MCFTVVRVIESCSITSQLVVCISLTQDFLSDSMYFMLKTVF